MKQIRIAILMDDIAKINPKKDSTLAMMLEASRRGWELYTFDSNDMFVDGGSVFAFASRTSVSDSETDWHTKTHPSNELLTGFDVILMRKDPPFDMDYIYSTYLLEQAEKNGVLVVNKPQSLRDANEKLFSLEFPECIPHTLVSTDSNKIRSFIKKHKVAVVKPLDGMGGRDIFKLTYGDSNVGEVLSYLTNNGKRQIIAQEFLERISEGDKRILVIDGNPIKYSLARIPAEGSFKGNLAAGAKGVGQKLSSRDKYLCGQVATTLREKGLLFVGLDVIGDYITEINVTSPTGIRELDSQFNLNIAAELFDVIEQKINI